MPDARVVRPIAGTDLRPGDLLGVDDDGALLAVRTLTPREIEAVRSNTDSLVVYRPLAPWLGLQDRRQPRAKATRGRLRLICVGERPKEATS